jgi:hypothetical protein
MFYVWKYAWINSCLISSVCTTPKRKQINVISRGTVRNIRNAWIRRYSSGPSFATLSNTSCTSVTHTSISPVSAVAEISPGLITLYASAWLNQLLNLEAYAVFETLTTHFALKINTSLLPYVQIVTSSSSNPDILWACCRGVEFIDDELY